MFHNKTYQKGTLIYIILYFTSVFKFHKRKIQYYEWYLVLYLQYAERSLSWRYNSLLLFRAKFHNQFHSP